MCHYCRGIVGDEAYCTRTTSSSKRWRHNRKFREEKVALELTFSKAQVPLPAWEWGKLTKYKKVEDRRTEVDVQASLSLRHVWRMGSRERNADLRRQCLGYQHGDHKWTNLGNLTNSSLRTGKWLSITFVGILRWKHTTMDFDQSNFSTSYFCSPCLISSNRFAPCKHLSFYSGGLVNQLLNITIILQWSNYWAYFRKKTCRHHLWCH